MLIMGILNVTPDSFADGGRHNEFAAAVARGLEMISEGVDIIDIGGESTRPGADRVSEAEELERTIPVIKELAMQGARISIDTMRASIAEAAIKAGASIINDVSGGLADPLMLQTAARLQVPYIAMHWRGQSKDMNSKAIYGDVVADVIEEVTMQLDKALAAGVKRENIILDPGLGFAKDPEHNWEILNRIEEFTALGYPVLIGHSRKRFLGGDNPDGREEATVAVTQSLVGKGIWAVRVHGVKANVEVVKK